MYILIIFPPKKNPARAPAERKGPKGILSFIDFFLNRRKTAAKIAPDKKERKKERRETQRPRCAPIPAASLTSPPPIPG